MADAHWNGALLRLLLGDFERGWVERQWGRRCAGLGFVDRQFAQPLWRGEADIAGKTILLHSDEGLGDTIQFARYAKLVAGSARVSFSKCRMPCIRCCPGIEGVALCLPKTGVTLPDFDLQCPTSDLPLVFATRLDTIPSATSYLSPRSGALREWQARLGGHDRLRVGLVWSGNPAHNNDGNRSMPLSTMAALLDVDACFISLQKDPRPADQAFLNEKREIVDLTAHLTDFAETAALIACLDLVITVDTSVAHLAGALGVRPGSCCLTRPTSAGCSIATTAPGIRAYGYSGKARPAIMPKCWRACTTSCRSAPLISRRPEAVHAVHLSPAGRCGPSMPFEPRPIS